MSRMGFAAFAILLAGSGPALKVISTESCTSAQAQTQTASDEPTIWDHNGSVMSLVAKGSAREFYYQKPRPGMLDAGARPGSLLFRGQIKSGQYEGTAYIFNLHCGPIPFEVKGPILDDEQIALTGQAPRVGRECHAYGAYASSLEFRRLKPNEPAQSQEPFRAGQVPPAGEPKVEVSSRTGAEPAGVSKNQAFVKRETPAAGKDVSATDANSKVPSAPIVPAAATNETSHTKVQDKYLWGAAFVVMIVWLLIFSLGKILLRL
jgi:hypothetical protein